MIEQSIYPFSNKNVISLPVICLILIVGLMLYYYILIRNRETNF